MSIIKDTWDDLTGRSQRDAAREGARDQEQAGRDAIDQFNQSRDMALGFYDPYSAIGQNVEQYSNFLTDPQAQYDWLQNNPLFDASLSYANDATKKLSAAQGRLSAGDTLMQLRDNTFLAAQPLLGQQMGNINNLMNLGFGASQGMANAAIGTGSQIGNTMMGIGNAQAAGRIGAANAMSDGLGNIAELAGNAVGFGGFGG